jgi:hypothetical protein
MVKLINELRNQCHHPYAVLRVCNKMNNDVFMRKETYPDCTCKKFWECVCRRYQDGPQRI